MADIGVKKCAMCEAVFPVAELDFLERCEACFRQYIQSPTIMGSLLFQNTGNPHNPKETKAYVDRLEKKRLTPDGIDHNYVKRIYG